MCILPDNFSVTFLANSAFNYHSIIFARHLKIMRHLSFLYLNICLDKRSISRPSASFSTYEIAYKYRKAPRRMPNVINRGHSSSWPMFLFAWCRLTDGFAAFRECCRGRCESTRKLDSRHLKQMKGGGTGRKKEAESRRNKRNIYGERQHARLARRRKGTEVLALVR